MKAVFALGALEQSFSGALQVGFLKHFGDVATVLLDLVFINLKYHIRYKKLHKGTTGIINVLQWYCTSCSPVVLVEEEQVVSPEDLSYSEQAYLSQGGVGFGYPSRITGDISSDGELLQSYLHNIIIFFYIFEFSLK